MDFVSYIYDICSVWFLRVVLFHSVFTFFSFINHRRLYCVQFLILFHLTQIRSLIFVLQLFSHLWGILIIFSSQFSLIFLQTQRRLCTLLSYSYADWDSLRNHLRDVPSEDIFNLISVVLLPNFVTGSNLELILTVNIRSSLIHLCGIPLLLLLPWCEKVTSYTFLNIKNLLLL